MADSAATGAVTLDVIVDPAAMMRASALSAEAVLRRAPGGGLLRGLMTALAVGGAAGLVIALGDIGIGVILGAGVGIAIGAALTVIATRRASLRLLRTGFRALEDPPRCEIALDARGVGSRIGGHASGFDWRAISAMPDGPDGPIPVAGFHAVLLPDAALPEGMDRAAPKAAIGHRAGRLDRRSGETDVF